MDYIAARELLDSLGAVYQRDRTRTNGETEILIECLSDITGHVQDSGNSASFNIDKEVFSCFSCGAAFNVPQMLIASGLALHWGEALEQTKKYSDFVPEQWTFKPLTGAFEAANKLLLPEIDPVSALLYRGKGHSWLTKVRGLPKEVCKEAGVHYHPIEDAIRFPVTDHLGRLVAYVDRPFPDSPKYNPENKYLIKPDGVQKSKLLYGFGMAQFACKKRGYLIVVEGPMDVLNLRRLGYYNVVASLGTHPSDDQIFLMTLLSDRLVIGHDNPQMDKAGAKSSWSLARKAEKHFASVTLGAFYYGVKDPGEFDDDDIENFVENQKTLLQLQAARTSLEQKGRL